MSEDLGAARPALEGLSLDFFTERVINFYLVEATLLGFFLFYADNSPNCRRQSSYLEADHLRLEAALLIWGKKFQ